MSDPGAAEGVAASASFRFQIFGPHGSGVALAVDAPPRTARLRVSGANPFTLRTGVRFDLARASRVTLGVYDVGGRLRRRLLENPFAAPGSYSVAWDGKDDAGKAVAAGVYFSSLRTDRETQSARVVRIP